MNDCDNTPESAVKEREKYIIVEIKNLQGIATKQEVLRNELLDRLTPVTRSEPAKQGMGPSESCGVPLADELAVVASDFSITNDILEDILNRLEI